MVKIEPPDGDATRLWGPRQQGCRRTPCSRTAGTATSTHRPASVIPAACAAGIIVNVFAGARRSESNNGEVWRTVDGPKTLTGVIRWIWHQLASIAGLVDPRSWDADVNAKVALRRKATTDYLCALPDRAGVIDPFDTANLTSAVARNCGEVFGLPTIRHRNTIINVDDSAGGTRDVDRNPYC